MQRTARTTRSRLLADYGRRTKADQKEMASRNAVERLRTIERPWRATRGTHLVHGRDATLVAPCAFVLMGGRYRRRAAP
jgi:hypothetical protein